MANPGTSSRWAAPVRSVLTGAGCFFLGSISDLWVQRHAASVSIAVIDDALVGVGVGLLVYLYEQRYRRYMIRKLEVIRLMNHHVRNSLQVISFAASAQQREVESQLRDAVERIEWALREVLPGQREDIASLSLQGPSTGSAQKSRNVA